MSSLMSLSSVLFSRCGVGFLNSFLHNHKIEHFWNILGFDFVLSFGFFCNQCAKIDFTDRLSKSRQHKLNLEGKRRKYLPLQTKSAVVKIQFINITLYYMALR
ncbi:hypothetical protein DFJ63DRAFT_314144 [Scheffersomyces coipomensis]|uniref:uncharacterized protein n=1 Tax=Scheffersomyces coipomensis TaxID=1788519 RepID=UPI00315DC3D1